MIQRQEAGELDPARPHLVRIVGENVYQRRVLKVPKMSQDRLAQLSGVVTNTIQALERGRDPEKELPAYPRLDTIEKLAAGLGCDVADLLKWEPTRAKLHAVPFLSPSSVTMVPERGMQASPKQLPLLVPVRP